ncbi:MAG: NACHT domain-containing protein [Desulfobacteraceae bacterium]|jgi:hypothetical protein
MILSHSKKIEKLKEFKDENELRIFLMDLFKLIGFSDVQLTHKYGAPEFGKDIIASLDHPLDKKEWYAFVVKHGRVTGGTDSIEKIKNQIKQSFEYPYECIDGNNRKINKVRVITNEHFTQGAIEAIRKSPHLQIYTNFDFWWNEKLIEFIDKKYPEFWLPGDFISKEYTKAVNNLITNEFEIKELSVTKIPEGKIKKLLDLFITPYLLEFSSVIDNKFSKKVETKKIEIDEIIDDKGSFIIEGDPGAGKSRLVNRLITLLLDPSRLTEDNIFPIKVKLPTLKKNKFDIITSMKDEIYSLIPDENHRFNFEEASFTVFIDSIDDLYPEDIKILSKNISSLINGYNYRFIITARSLENISFSHSKKKVRELHLQNFNQRQIEKFVRNYFDDANRGKRFIEVLKTSNILEKLPTTPLTITLISLLYEDTDYEIPATLTDIYNDFTDVLLGKLEIKNKLQLMDLVIKKRIFSHISYQLLEKKEFEIDKEEFIDKVEEYLNPKGYYFDDRDELLRLLIKTGILYLDTNTNRIGFKHLSFLEYFSAYEILYVKNTWKELIAKFNDVNWQNTAIFYAGFSKDMPWFINDLIKKLPNKELRDHCLNVSGMGYLAQALYMTDTGDRAKLVEKSLDEMICSFTKLKDLTGNKGPYLNMPLHIVGAMLIYWFTMNFRSITLVECLELVYDKIVDKNKEELERTDFEIGFKLFIIACTLATQYLKNYDKLNDLIDRGVFNKDPLLIVLADMFLDFEEIDDKNVSREKRLKIGKEIKRYKQILVDITKEPAYRFNSEYKKIKKKIEAPKII